MGYGIELYALARGPSIDDAVCRAFARLVPTALRPERKEDEMGGWRLTLMVTIGLNGWTHSAAADAHQSPAPRPTLNLELRNMTTLSPAVLAKARETLTQIYHAAGIGVQWKTVGLARRTGPQAPGAGPAQRARGPARRADHRRGGAPAGAGRQRRAPPPRPPLTGRPGRAGRPRSPSVHRAAVAPAASCREGLRGRLGCGPREVGPGGEPSGGGRGGDREAGQHGTGDRVVVAQALRVHAGPGERAGHLDRGVRADREPPRVRRPGRVDQCAVGRAHPDQPGVAQHPGRRRRRGSPRFTDPAAKQGRRAARRCGGSALGSGAGRRPAPPRSPAAHRPAWRCPRGRWPSTTSTHIPAPRKSHEPGPGQGQQLAHPEAGRTTGHGVEEGLPPGQVHGPGAGGQHAGTGQPGHLAVHRQHGHEGTEVRGVPVVDVLAQVLGDPLADQRLQRVQPVGVQPRPAGGPARRSRRPAGPAPRWVSSATISGESQRSAA